LFVAFHTKIHAEPVFMNPTNSRSHLSVACCAGFFVIAVGENNIRSDSVNTNPLHGNREGLPGMTVLASGGRR